MFGMLEDKEQLNKNGIGLGLNIGKYIPSLAGFDASILFVFINYIVINKGKQICNVFGGDITVESKVGLGSNFKFCFDVTPPIEDEE